MRNKEEINAQIEWYKSYDKNIDKRLEEGRITRCTWESEKEQNEIKIKLLEWVIS